MSTLVVQTYLTGHWHDALRLVFDDPSQGPQQGACTLSYLAAYLSDHLDDFGTPTAAAVSANLPLSWEVERLPHWPAFLHDILPAGAARRFLLPRLGLSAEEAAQTDFQLLSRCTPAPIGHLRIRESLDEPAQTLSVGFTREQVALAIRAFWNMPMSKVPPSAVQPARVAMHPSCCWRKILRACSIRMPPCPMTWPADIGW